MYARQIIRGTTLSTLAAAVFAAGAGCAQAGRNANAPASADSAAPAAEGDRAAAQSPAAATPVANTRETKDALLAAQAAGAPTPPPSPTSLVAKLMPRFGLERRTDGPVTVRGRAEPVDREQYAVIDENPFLAVSANPRSTFSIDVDHASYSNVRRFIREGHLPPRDAVRIEELVNYFPPNVATDEDGENPFTVASEVGPAPWNREHRLARVVLQGREIKIDALPPSNLVFLIDVSGSMQSPDKLPLLKQAFQLLVSEMRPQDRVAIVVYAGNAGLVLPSTSGRDKDKILDAIAGLEAGGSTAGGAGIQLAYEVAREHFMSKGNNRVILATDGDFNVGVSSDAELVQLIEEKRKHGIFLTVLGFGTGNLQDAKMEQLADRGNGNYAYVDDIGEARKVLVEEIGATLVTIAKDVKLQVEFNPARVAAYRLIGYENRLLRDEDFADDTKDAGEMGAGQTVTALYEIVPVGASDANRVRRPDSLRYSTTAPRRGAENARELMYVKLRYKAPNDSTSRLFDHAIVDADRTPSDDFTFTAAVASFGMLLRQSEHRGRASFEDVIAMADAAKGTDPFGYRAEFVKLAREALAIATSDNDGRRVSGR